MSVAADSSFERPLLTVTRLSKSFPGVRALSDVDFDLRAGEIHALVGENGAGKSTFVKALGGGIVPDAGEVLLDGSPLPFGDPLAARRRRVDVIYQEFTLVPQLTSPACGERSARSAEFRVGVIT